jgi:hypothetical protein
LIEKIGRKEMLPLRSAPTLKIPLLKVVHSV